MVARTLEVGAVVVGTVVHILSYTSNKTREE